MILRFQRQEKFSHAHQLRNELEEKLSVWRQQVLAVQFESIRCAEERVHAQMSARALRVSSENRERAHRNIRILHALERDRSACADERLRSFDDKMKKANLVIKEKEEAKEKSREHASRMSKLREAVR